MYPSTRKLGLALSTAAVLIAAGPSRADEVKERPRQAVIISFDGASDIGQWQRSRTLAAVTGGRFTYFLSCVFLLAPEHRSSYQAPGHKAGRSNVGFARSMRDVAARLNQIWLARSEGHEIASHGCGHFDGAAWTSAQWKREFSAFGTVLRDAWTLNGIAGEPQGWRRFAEREIVGFRAPYLSTGDGLYTALPKAGYTYDASAVSRGPAKPQDRGGIVRYALPQIPEGPAQRRVIAMDYNLFVRHSGGFERKDEGSAFEDRTVDALTRAFDDQYEGSRTPLQVGFHFTLMNGGAYWRALERFAKDVCLRPEVDCISYADLTERLHRQRAVAAGG